LGRWRPDRGMAGRHPAHDLRARDDPRLHGAHPRHHCAAPVATQEGRHRAPVSDPRIALLPALHLDVLYERDDRGRLSRVRSDSVATPLVHFMRTATGNHWLIGTALPDDTAARLDTVLAEEPVLMPEDWESSEPRCLEVAR